MALIRSKRFSYSKNLIKLYISDKFLPYIYRDLSKVEPYPLLFIVVDNTSVFLKRFKVLEELIIVLFYLLISIIIVNRYSY